MTGLCAGVVGRPCRWRRAIFILDLHVRNPHTTEQVPTTQSPIRAIDTAHRGDRGARVPKRTVEIIRSYMKTRGISNARAERDVACGMERRALLTSKLWIYASLSDKPIKHLASCRLHGDIYYRFHRRHRHVDRLSNIRRLLPSVRMTVHVCERDINATPTFRRNGEEAPKCDLLLRLDKYR